MRYLPRVGRHGTAPQVVSCVGRIVRFAPLGNARHYAEAMDAVRRALGNANAGQGLWELAKSINAPLALKDLGFKETDIEKATEIALKNPYWNPRPLEAEGLRALLRRAWAGDAPQA